MIGFDKPLYLLAFDHRSSIQSAFGWKGALTPAQTGQITSAKQVIYDGFKAVLAQGVPKSRIGILVDELFGAAILRDAVERRYLTACACEKSGLEESDVEFDFEYGEEFDQHIEAFQPTFCKVSVRYDPDGDRDWNARQSARLRRLSEYLHNESQSLFLFELLVPSRARELPTQMMVRSIEALQDEQIEPDVWIVQALDRREDCQRIVAAARRDDRDRVGCIVLGWGDDDLKIRHSLAIAASVPGYLGFAVDLTSFWEPLVGLRQEKIMRSEAVSLIAMRYRRFINIFLKERIAAA